MSKHHGLYKFVTCDTNEIIYIGKTNNNLKSRVADHIRGKGIDEKFNAYKGNYKVYVSFLPNAVETDIMERALINQYKPILNGTDNNEGISNLIKIEEPKWIEFEKVFHKCKPDIAKKKQKVKKNKRSDDICIGTLFGRKYYLSNTHTSKPHGKKIIIHYFNNVDEALEYIKYILYLCEKHGTYNVESHRYVVPGQYAQQLYHFWENDKYGLGPGFIISGKDYHTSMCIITSMSGTGNILEYIKFNDVAIDIFKLIIDDLSNTDNNNSEVLL